MNHQHEDQQRVCPHDDDEAQEQKPRQYWRSGCLLSQRPDPSNGFQPPDGRQSFSPVHLVQGLNGNLQKVLSAISSVAPNYVYNVKWKEKKIDSYINPEFREIWRNVLTIFYEEDHHHHPSSGILLSI